MRHIIPTHPQGCSVRHFSQVTHSPTHLIAIQNCQTQVFCRPRASCRWKKVQWFPHIIVLFYPSQRPAQAYESSAELTLARPRKYWLIDRSDVDVSLQSAMCNGLHNYHQMMTWNIQLPYSIHVVHKIHHKAQTRQQSARSRKDEWDRVRGTYSRVPKRQ